MMRCWGGSFMVAGLMALTACAPASSRTAITQTDVRTQVRAPAPVRPTAVVVPSQRSDSLRTFYQRLESDLVTRGLLRTDGGGPDTPFTDTQLARNFIRIALFDEYISEGDVLLARATASRLSRWTVPVRMSVGFGKTIPAAQRGKDRADVTNYAARLSRVTRHPITITDDDPNFHVLFLNENDRLGAEAQLRQIVPKMGPSSMRAILNLPAEQLCIVVAFSQAGRTDYSKTIAIVRGEHPDLLRKSCIHEELAQGLGLPNDSPAARPSIFNDDEEFGLLTTHDELLLRLLYDRRLRPGMDAAEAAPIVRRIATELTGGGAS
jgi:hypothetical protein